MDEKDLIDGLRRGDEDAFRTLVTTHLPRLRAVALRIVRDAHLAEDCVQEAFVRALRSLDRFRGESLLGTWLHRIVVNACLDELRRRPLTAGDADLAGPAFDGTGCRVEPPGPPMRSPEELVGTERERRQVHAAIDRLPEDYRTVLVLRDIEELSTREAAESLGISEGAVKVRLHRARGALKVLLEPLLGRSTP